MYIRTYVHTLRGKRRLALAEVSLLGSTLGSDNKQHMDT